MGLRYGIGYLGTALVTQVVVQWVTYFYAPPLDRGLPVYLPIGMVGIAMVIGRIVDAVADPLVGVWSDNTRHPLGRRIPFIRYGMLPLALSFILIWNPLGTSPTTDFIYLSIMLSLFFFFFTVVVAPYLALLPELSKDRTERVKLTAWQALFNIVGLALAMVGSSLLISNFGFRVMGIVLGIITLLGYAVTAFGVQEERKVGQQQTMGLAESVRLTLKNHPFLVFVASQLLFWFGFNMTMVTIPYVVTILMGMEEGAVGIVLGVALGVSLLSFPVVTGMAKRLGYKMSLQITMGTLALVLILLGSIGLWPGLSAAWQGYLIIAVAGFPLAGLFILPNAVLAEITDYDFSLTSSHREAIYFGVQGFVLKSAMGLSSLVVAFVLETFGYSLTAPLGVRLSGPVAGFFVLVGVLIFARYPEQIVGGHCEK